MKTREAIARVDGVLGTLEMEQTTPNLGWIGGIAVPEASRG